MESEERPSKMRKLSHNNILDEPNALEDSEIAQTSDKTEAGYSKSHSDDLTPTLDRTSDSDLPKTTAETAEVQLPLPNVVAPSANSLTSNPADPPLSKNQQKKLAKKLDWESKRDSRKIVRKEKLVAKRERKREARDTIRLENGEDISLPPAPPKRHTRR